MPAGFGKGFCGASEVLNLEGSGLRCGLGGSIVGPLIRSGTGLRMKETPARGRSVVVRGVA